jgi:hypothetical protein
MTGIAYRPQQLSNNPASHLVKSTKISYLYALTHAVYVHTIDTGV